MVENPNGNANEVQTAMDVGPTISNEHPRLLLNRHLGSPATFELIGEEGPPNAKVFTVKTVIKGTEFQGQGRSKKLAFQDASEVALLTLFNTKYEAPSETSQELGKRKAGGGDAQGYGKKRVVANTEVKTALMRLNEIKKGLQWSCQEEGDVKTKNKEYTMTVLVDEQSYIGKAGNKQGAKQAAASAALKVLDPSFTEGAPLNKKKAAPNVVGVQGQGGVILTGAHPRMVLNEQVGKPVEVIVVNSMGQGIDSKFNVKVEVNGHEFFGQGASKKVAATQACENALMAMFKIKYNAALKPPQQQKKQKGGFVSAGVQMMS